MSGTVEESGRGQKRGGEQFLGTEAQLCCGQSREWGEQWGKQGGGRSGHWHKCRTRGVRLETQSGHCHNGKRREAGSADDGDGGVTSVEEGLGPGAAGSLEVSMGGRYPEISFQADVDVGRDRGPDGMGVHGS